MTDSAPWYKEGLCFQCTRCGKCCTGESGYVWVSPKEIESIAQWLHMSTEDFSRRYIRRRFDRYALIEIRRQTAENTTVYDCVFLKENTCLIYDVRPQQCKTFPWWKEHLVSREAWDCAALRCEGIHNEAPLVPYERIQQVASDP